MPDQRMKTQQGDVEVKEISATEWGVFTPGRFLGAIAKSGGSFVALREDRSTPQAFTSLVDAVQYIGKL